MSATKKLSPTMEAAMRFIGDAGGTLLRRNGGYWTPVGKSHVEGTLDFIGTSTLVALEARGLVKINRGHTPSATLAQPTGATS